MIEAAGEPAAPHLKIGVIGSRGVPATFGGIERHVEELGARLVARGHHVTVYCRSNYVAAGITEHRGMELRSLRGVGTKHFDAIGHSVMSTADALRRNFDVLHYHGMGPGIPAIAPRVRGKAAIVQTIHGMDNERAKWGAVAKGILSTAAWMSARVPDEVIVVSHALQDHYRQRYGRPATYVCNGVNEPTVRAPRRIVSELGLKPGKYVLFVGRLVPEKDPEILIEAFRRVDGDFQLVIVGGSSFTDGYVERLQGLAERDSRVTMAGYAYGDLLEELYSNAGLFVLPSHLEGLPLTLLEAASYGCPTIASDIPPHREVLEKPDLQDWLVPVGDTEALAAVISKSLADPEESRRKAAIARAAVVSRFEWDRAAVDTEAVYLSALHDRRRPSTRSTKPN
jgi:glycosyltransferase involved in cell wall biosynthesis